MSVRPGFAFLTASLIACFSPSVKFAGSFTATFDGSFSPVSSPDFDTTFTLASTGSVEPSLYCTSTGILISFPASASVGVYFI